MLQSTPLVLIFLDTEAIFTPEYLEEIWNILKVTVPSIQEYLKKMLNANKNV